MIYESKIGLSITIYIISEFISYQNLFHIRIYYISQMEQYPCHCPVTAPQLTFIIPLSILLNDPDVSEVKAHFHCDHPSSSSSSSLATGSMRSGSMRSGVSNTSALRFGFSTRHLWSTAWSGTPIWSIRKYLAYDGWSLARTMEGEGGLLPSVAREWESADVIGAIEFSSRHASVIAWLSISSDVNWLDVVVVSTVVSTPDWVDVFTVLAGAEMWSSPGMEDNFASSTESVASVRWIRQFTSSNLNDYTKQQS